MSKAESKECAHPRARWKLFVVSLSVMGNLAAVTAPLAPSSKAAAHLDVTRSPPPLSAHSDTWDLTLFQSQLPADASNSRLNDQSEWLDVNVNSRVVEPTPPANDQLPAQDRIAALSHSDAIDSSGTLTPPDFGRPKQSPSRAEASNVSKPDIFGSFAIAAPNMRLATVTRRAFTAANTNAAASRQCKTDQTVDCVVGGRTIWTEMLAEARRRSDLEQLDWVNRQVNIRLKYVTDQTSHGVLDYWSPAHETMRRQSGDCEDFAILKLWLLEQLGYDAADMFVVVVQSQRLAVQHAVLGVRRGDEFLILDNLSNRVTKASDVDDYRPMYSVSPKGFWIHGFPTSQQVATVTRPPL